MDTIGAAAVRERIGEILESSGLAIGFVVRNDTEADVSCTGVRSVLRRADVGLDAGLAGQYVFSLLCKASQLSAATLEPRRTRIVIGAAEYRLLATEADALGTAYRLHLGGLRQ